MKISTYIKAIQGHPDFRDAVVFHRRLPGRGPVYGPATDLHPDLAAAMKRMGCEALYRHQAEALRHLREGASVLVATPTASGKSLIYNLAVLEEILRAPSSRALYVFPLKALEQDQLKNLGTWLEGIRDPEVRADIYDGDTTPYRRQKLRARPPHILFTNPDMLHRAILPHHAAWEDLFRNLSFVVLDEVHAYRGIFGSHLNQVIRRLKRLCRKYGSRPRFILLSATISNPREFGESLVEEKIRVVRSTGAPRAARDFLFLNPGDGSNFTAAKLFIHSLRRGFRTIVFTQSRKVTELIHLWVSQLSPALGKKVSSYRAGFMPGERRAIEKRLADGDLLGVVSTSALEMGIDIGHLDVCILVGYPGTIINTWQRGGRVGRAGRDSLVILLAKPDALDQYFMKHPEDFFGRPFEAAVLDPDNRYVLEAHLPCAAAEMPLTLADQRFWPGDLRGHLENLERSGALHRSAEGEPAWYAARRSPHRFVNMRSAGETYTIFEKETGEAIGTIGGIKAFKECHPGAVYLHHARQYLVERLMLEERDIIVHHTDLRYFTRTRTEKETEIMETLQSRPEGQFLVREGRLKVTETVTGFEKRKLPGQELMGVFPLDLPPRTFETIGLWVEIEPEIKAFVEREGRHFMGGIHAIEHAAIGMFPLFALCDRNDIGGICYPHHPQVGKSAVFIYDGYPGGVGLASRGFEVIFDLLERTYRHVSECECEDGCPSCIHSPKCGSGNKPLDKKGALLILECLLGRIALSDICGDAGDPGPMPVSVDPPPAPEASSAPRILFLDLETRKTAREVGGWHNTRLMRISVAVLFDSLKDDFIVFEEDRTADLLAHLDRADLIVGFNIKKFDYSVLGAYTGKDLRSLPTFDILEDVHRRLGFRLSLDHLAKETLNRGKTAHGLQAVEWFRKGEMEKLTKYCREDVAVTRDLFRYGLENGHLVYREKRSGTRLRLRVDWELDKLLQ